MHTLIWSLQASTARKSKMPVQGLDARYVDLQKLVLLLRSTFGAGNFTIDTEVSYAPSACTSTSTDTVPSTTETRSF